MFPHLRSKFFVKLVSILVLTCLIGSLVEPVVAFAADSDKPKKSTPSWWPYWQVGGYRKNCLKSAGDKWGSEYCTCWWPLGWAMEPIMYKSQKDWRNKQWERHWKWWSRIRMNYAAMIRTEVKDSSKNSAISTSASDQIMIDSDNVLRAANALCVAPNYDRAFDVYFPEYLNFIAAAVEDIRLTQQWIDLETNWVICLNKSGNQMKEEAENLNKLHKLIWENDLAIAKVDDVIEQIIGLNPGGIVQSVLDFVKKALGYIGDIVRKVGELAGELTKIIQPIIDFVKKATTVVQQIKDKVNQIKDRVKSIAEKIPLVGDLLGKYIDENVDADKILGNLFGSFNPLEMILKFEETLKKLAELKDADTSDVLDLLKKITSSLGLDKISDFLDKLKGLLDLKAYKYGQTQVLQAVGSQAAQMAMAANRTNRELNGFLEMQLTAEHTKVARQTAVRNNMVIAGKKAQTASSAKKVKLGF